MSKKTTRGPRPAEQLYKNLFGDPPLSTTLQLVTQGIAASWRNADRLLSDSQALVDAGRLSSARFLLTTAREELAKPYILIDACRLDHQKHESVQRRLCQAFYDHISKHAYLKVLNFTNLHSMSDAKAIWDTEVKRWWPAEPEDGEPDMPHDTYFGREFPLYVDFIDYDQQWSLPTDSDQNYHFEELFGETPLSEVEKLIKPWREADAGGLCTPEILGIMNDVFQAHYLRETSTHSEIIRLYERAADRVEAETDSSAEFFMESPFVEWPLYHFASGAY